MKIKYLGTAAYEGIPAAFCNCESCKRALALGGKNMRTRSQAIINDQILMDFNADTIVHYQKYKFDWNKIKYCLITHSHSDHFYPSDMLMLVEPGYVHGAPHIDFYAGESSYNQMREIFESAKSSVEGDRAGLFKVKPKDFFQMGENQVLVLDADHDKSSSPVIYAIKDGNGKTVLYAHDTGIFTDEVVEEMKRIGRFDLVSFDCTGSFAPTGWEHGHMGLRANVNMKEKLLQAGLVDDKTTFVVTHFSHNAFYGHDHEELCSEAAKYGFIVGYDGMEIEV